VLSAPGKRGKWEEAEIYGNMEEEWRKYLVLWSRYGLDTASCLEIGCGVGRFTPQLLKTFGTVHAVDVSEGMIARARNVAPGAIFHAGDGRTLPLPPSSVSAVFSTLVFQHLCESNVAAYFDESYRVLTGGGTLLVQMPFHLLPYPGGLQRHLYEALRKALVPLNALAGVVRRMQYTSSCARKTVSRLERIGFADVQITLPASVVMARKP
jgi:ubiquinone/menaquinone biosynthesis C-methylase UbiE